MESKDPLSRIVIEHPSAADVFHRLGIDYFCRGERSLEDACREAAIDAQEVLARIAEEEAARPSGETRWHEEPVERLIDHILFAYHEPLKEDLGTIEERFLEAERESAADKRLAELHSAFRALRAELEQHLMKEEEILFPMIRSGQGDMADGPILVMRHEHDDARAALERIRELTDGFARPENPARAALVADLDRFCASLERHIHLENNVLFPRVG